jgi:hypothetical protein
MKSLATAISDTTTGIALFIKELKAIPVLGSAISFLFDDIGTGIIFSKAGKERRERLAYNKNEHKAREQALKSTSVITKLSGTQLSNQKKLLNTQKQIAAEKKKQEILDKAALLLAQGQKVFDEEGIQLAAAAQGKLTEEERTRLNLKTDIFNLEAAINEGNIAAATRLSNSMVANAQKLSALRGDMIGLNDIQNPFDAWLQTLKLMAAELAAMTKLTYGLLPTHRTAGSQAEIEANLDVYRSYPESVQTELFGSPLLPKGSLPSTNAGTFMEGPEAARFFNQMSASGSAGGMGTSVTVNISGSVTTERDLVDAITQGIYNNQAAGIPINYSTAY